MAERILGKVIQLELKLENAQKYLLSRLQQKMGTMSPEATVERAFKEYVVDNGVSFRDDALPPVVVDALQRTGLMPSPGIPLMRELRGSLIITLPDIEDGGWDKLKLASGAESIKQIAAFALEAAEKRYVA